MQDTLEPIDLTLDESWEPMFNPYEGRETPAWMIMARARWQLGYPLEHSSVYARFEMQ
jgi:hypothetical protein